MASRSPLSRNKYLTAFFINSSRIFLISIPDALSSKVLRNGERVFPYQGPEADSVCALPDDRFHSNGAL